MYFNRKCKITFICNGATIFSEDDRFTDLENYPPINEKGQEEIERICEFLKKRGVK
jgi:broad specificity phosphatase PhoE